MAWGTVLEPWKDLLLALTVSLEKGKVYLLSEEMAMVKKESLRVALVDLLLGRGREEEVTRQKVQKYHTLRGDLHHRLDCSHFLQEQSQEDSIA